MAQKKDRAFFICPRWSEVAGASVTGGASMRGQEKVLAAIKGGQPVAKSTLRRALLAARQASGVSFDVESMIVDKRTPQ